MRLHYRAARDGEKFAFKASEINAPKRLGASEGI